MDIPSHSLAQSRFGFTYLAAQQAGAPAMQAGVPACTQFCTSGQSGVPFSGQSAAVDAGLVKPNRAPPESSAAAPTSIILRFIGSSG
ncbi:hypothetical protein H8B13_20275 [Hymenobacter sp. BT188]|uniref:hypothetical protein n=1 Tax=Hymenobacter TaxID=89966 RepID=UPI001058587F|nr:MULTISPECIES: hypothetical protein [Hymenobacter]MBC6609167.1 hypothetical protein [Hymenobacter sp. BT188]QIL78182.1 hypothetical protein G7064_20350 [Hymenobacter sp. HDW8]